MMMKLLDKQEQICQWCRKVIPAHQTGILGTTEGMIFCTEACFAQSRRASFKRAKTCDWCRHVRHAVSYVDFQDGASQLQFCSDKCLNQYKMQIFCNETQAHLEMNPHLKEKSSSAGSLITPELWMKNCKSCSMSPVSERSESVSPVPSLPLRSSPEPSPIASVRHSPTTTSGSGLTSSTPASTSVNAKKPLISVAPPSKLLSKGLQSAPSLQSRVSSPKNARKRQRGSHRSVGSQGMVKRAASLHQPTDGSVAQGTVNNNNVTTIPNNNLSISPSTMKASCSVITAPNVQDLRLLQKKHHSLAGAGVSGTPFDGRDTVLVGSSATGAPGAGAAAVPPQPPHFLPPSLNLMRPPFFPLNPGGRRFNPQHLLQPPHASPAMPPPPSPLPGAPPPATAAGPMGHHSTRPPQPPLPPLPGMLGLGAPPVTILVPYPIIVPLPLPIPVPIPVIDFLKAALPKEAKPSDGTPHKQETAAAEEEEQEEEVNGGQDPRQCDEPSDVCSEGPLDFTLAAVGKRKDKDILLYDRLTASATTADNNQSSGACAASNDEEEQQQQQLAYALAASADEAMEETSGGATGATVPKFKIKRYDGMLHELDHTTTVVESVVERDGGKDDDLEDDMERERKELVDRSRPLRKRKRLVVAQQPSPAQAVQPKEPSMAEEEPDYCCSTGLEIRDK
ncbi:hypothetical protein AND_003048 [Anopheles darlingi]|uniref:Sine oculis-binding protein n=1 Tax=Anopheles darlingi TaxID=43151 RepID=W5JR14_ANODA|nr:hypothetical protein AND_003048 [Anopheles darlingi]